MTDDERGADSPHTTGPGSTPAPGDGRAARRRFLVLTWAAVACGIGAFVVTLVISQLLVPGDDGLVQIGAPVLAWGVAFGVLIALCIVLGYAAARRR